MNEEVMALELKQMPLTSQVDFVIKMSKFLVVESDRILKAMDAVPTPAGMPHLNSVCSYQNVLFVKDRLFPMLGGCQFCKQPVGSA